MILKPAAEAETAAMIADAATEGQVGLERLLRATNHGKVVENAGETQHWRLRCDVMSPTDGVHNTDHGVIVALTIHLPYRQVGRGRCGNSLLCITGLHRPSFTGSI